MALRSAEYFEAVRSVFEVVLFLEDAVITPVFFFLRLIFRPDSSSDEEYAESSLSEAGGGVAARFRKLDLPFAERFLKIATGAGGAVEASVDSITRDGLTGAERFESLDDVKRCCVGALVSRLRNILSGVGTVRSGVRSTVVDQGRLS